MTKDSLLERLAAVGRELTRGLVQLFFPGCCYLCARALPPDEGSLCGSCRSALLTDPFPACPRCAATVGPFGVVEDRCPHCRDESFAFEQVLRVGPYDGLLRETVLRLKHHSSEGLAEAVGELWAEQAGPKFQAFRADVLVPVPLHWRRRFRRGYNQSTALAHGLSARLRLPVLTSCLRRIRHTPFQTHQSVTGRRDNVRNAFQPLVRLPGKAVLLVDDVLTTGATAHEAAKALRAAGAARVVVAVLARAHG